jgi:hypothetical protein
MDTLFLVRVATVREITNYLTHLIRETPLADANGSNWKRWAGKRHAILTENPIKQENPKTEAQHIYLCHVLNPQLVSNGQKEWLVLGPG